jgi:hypothetical protein
MIVEPRVGVWCLVVNGIATGVGDAPPRRVTGAASTALAMSNGRARAARGAT